MDNRNRNENFESMPFKMARLEQTAKNTPKCSSCSEMMQIFQATISVMNESIKLQNKAVMEALASQTVLIKTLIKQQADANGVRSSFPIRTEDELKTLDEKICEENKSFYMEAMKSLIGGRPKKKLISILDETIIMNYNIDGTHGKKRLKNYSRFFDILKDAFAGQHSGDPETAIRQCFQNVKKQRFQYQCMQRKAIKEKERKQQSVKFEFH